MGRKHGNSGLPNRMHLAPACWALEVKVATLLEKRAVVWVAEEEGPLLRSSFFLTTKIPNLKHFRMDILVVILPSLQRGWRAASVDLKDAYLVLAHPHSSDTLSVFDIQLFQVPQGKLSLHVTTVRPIFDDILLPKNERSVRFCMPRRWADTGPKQIQMSNAWSKCMSG